MRWVREMASCLSQISFITVCRDSQVKRCCHHSVNSFCFWAAVLFYGSCNFFLLMEANKWLKGKKNQWLIKVSIKLHLVNWSTKAMSLICSIPGKQMQQVALFTEKLHHRLIDAATESLKEPQMSKGHASALELLCCKSRQETTCSAPRMVGSDCRLWQFLLCWNLITLLYFQSSAPLPRGLDPLQRPSSVIYCGAGRGGALQLTYTTDCL